MFPFLFFLFSFPSMVLSASNFQKLDLPSTATGPESIAFDSLGQGPYTGISDGRIIKFQRTSGVCRFCFNHTNKVVHLICVENKSHINIYVYMYAHDFFSFQQQKKKTKKKLTIIVKRWVAYTIWSTPLNI